MTVYVDDTHLLAYYPPGSGRQAAACRLFADTQDELHLFAARLGLHRSCFQPGRPRSDGSPSPYWHYDLTATAGGDALRLGGRAVTWCQAGQIIRDREARADRAKLADQASHTSGLAYRAGDYARASRLLALAMQADPARASLWAERASRVHAAARTKAAAVAGPDDPRPLTEIIQARLKAAGIAPDDPAVRFIETWNTHRLTAARQAQPSPAGAAEPETGTGDISGGQREAQS